MAAAVLALGTVAFVRVPLLPAIGDSLVLRPGLLSLLTVVFGVGRLLADLPAGDVADRVAPLRAFAVAAIGLTAGSLLLAGAHSLATLLVAAGVLGVASSVVNTTGMTYFSHGPVERRGKSLATFSAALLGGQALGPAVAGLASGRAGWRATEVAAAAAAGLIGLVCLVYRSSLTPDVMPAVPRRVGASAAARADGQRRFLYFVSFAVFFGLGAMPQTLLPLVGAHGYGLSVGVVGVLLGVGALCRFAGAAVGGVVADRFSRKAALVPALLTMGAGAVLLELPGGAIVWIASVVLFSLGSFGVTVAATMLADLGGGVRVGRRLGMFRFAGDAGLVAGPLAAGWLYDAFGIRAAAAGVGGLLVACAAVSAVALAETRHVDVPVPLEARA